MAFPTSRGYPEVRANCLQDAYIILFTLTLGGFDCSLGLKHENSFIEDVARMLLVSQIQARSTYTTKTAVFVLADTGKRVLISHKVTFI